MLPCSLKVALKLLFLLCILETSLPLSCQGIKLGESKQQKEKKIGETARYVKKIWTKSIKMGCYPPDFSEGCTLAILPLCVYLHRSVSTYVTICIDLYFCRALLKRWIYF